MDSPKMIKTFKYNSHQQQQQQQQQQPMFRVIEPPPLNHFKSFAQNKSPFEDISFSSYLKSKDPSRNSRENDSSSPSDDAEISIFDAQKYFSENNDVKESQHQQQQASHQDNSLLPSLPRASSGSSSVDGHGRILRTRSFHSTPTASSEASWNSHTGLLANPPGINGVSMKNFASYQEKKRGSIARKWIFGRKCCCTGKKSVQVKEKASGSDNMGQTNSSKPKVSYSKRDCTMSPRSTITNNSLPLPQLVTSSMHFSPENDGLACQRRVSATGRAFPDHIPAVGFSFPILNPSQQAIKKGVTTTKTTITGPHLDPARESLEVFRPPSHRPGSPIPGGRDDDVGSDASSDLFEIESFSTHQTTTNSSYPIMYRDLLDDASTFNARRFANNTTRTSLDEPATPSVAATECYAPSEVSIDWSVTTAEGFDRASVSNFSLSASEFGNEAYLRRRQEEEEKRKGNNSGGGGHHGGLLLMSCRHEKAVSVGPQPVKCSAAEGIYPVHVGGRRPPRGGGGASNSRLAFVA